jgi:hypothetical protein
MAGRQPAWVRRPDLTEQETAVLRTPPKAGRIEATRYGTPPAALVGGLTVLPPIGQPRSWPVPATRRSVS